MPLNQTQYDELIEDWKYTTVFHIKPLTDEYPSYDDVFYHDDIIDWCREHFMETFGGLRWNPQEKDFTYNFIVGDNDISKPNAVAFKLRWL